MAQKYQWSLGDQIIMIVHRLMYIVDTDQLFYIIDISSTLGQGKYVAKATYSIRFKI